LAHVRSGRVERDESVTIERYNHRHADPTTAIQKVGSDRAGGSAAEEFHRYAFHHARANRACSIRTHRTDQQITKHRRGSIYVYTNRAAVKGSHSGTEDRTTPAFDDTTT
jgi:hypothetical protein